MNKNILRFDDTRLIGHNKWIRKEFYFRELVKSDLVLAPKRRHLINLTESTLESSWNWRTF